MYSETQSSLSINMTNLERTILIDRYLSGEMTEEEKLSFERLLSEGDSSSIDVKNLRKEMELQQEIESAIQERGLREMLQNIEAKIKRRQRLKKVMKWLLGGICILASITAVTLLFFAPAEDNDSDCKESIVQVEPVKTHYIFAVDVSLSMCKYEEAVRPAMEAFVNSLPMSDRLTIIPFAHDAITNKIGYDVTIDSLTRRNLIQLLPSLYPYGSDRRDHLYYGTDIYKAQQAVTKSVQMNQQYDVNIIVFITDMIHCPEMNMVRPFNSSEMDDMRALMKSAYCTKAESLVFMLVLPYSGSSVGYVLPQLKELYENMGVKVALQLVPENSEEIIRQWFEQNFLL